MGVTSTQQFTFRLVAEGVQLDTFSDEDILLSNNVTGLFDIGLQPADFTRQITIPGTKKNDAFFNQYYDISIQNPFLFSTNTKVNAYFDFGGIYLSQGYIQLNKVNVTANKFVDSYEITMYGLISSFGRVLQQNFLTDLLSLQKYNHTSSLDNIKASWSGSLFGGDIVYPWCDYGNGWTFTQGDDFFGVDDNYGGLSVQDFKPAIRVKAVLDAVFEESGYTYSSSFWNQDWIQDVYMVCNNQLRYPIYAGVDLETYGTMKLGSISGSTTTDITLPDNTWVTLPWYNVLENASGNSFGSNSDYIVPIQTNILGNLNLNINVSSSINNLPGQFWIRMIETGSSTPIGETTLVNFNQYFTQVVQSRNGSINQKFELSTIFPMTSVPAGHYYFQIKQQKYYTSASPLVKLDPGGTTKSFIQINKLVQAADGRTMDIPSNMPYGTKGIKLVDFISGLQKKFNLVMYPDKTKPNAFIIETFNNWYKTGNIKDFNKYINLDAPISVTPANNLAVNNLNFGDTLDTDYVSQQFYKGANREYGKTYYVDTQNFFSQGTLEVKTPFASSELIKVSGTGVSGSINGLNPGGNYTQYYMGGAGYNWATSTAACSGTYYYPITVYAAESNPLTISQFFTDPQLTTPFNGTGYFYKFYNSSSPGGYYSTDVAYGGYTGATIYAC
jgi:hypothetical protein